MNRRDLLKHAALSVVARRARSLGTQVRPTLNALQLEPFVDALPLPQRLTGSSPLRITMREIHAHMHRDLGAMRLWSYGPDAVAPLIEARAFHETVIEWRNALPPRHFLPIDYTLHGSGRELPESRTAVHLHGGRTPARDDGYPEHWYATGQSHVAHYPNHQDATMLWYHDHAMGTSRLNLYAGLMGVYLLRDAREDSLQLPTNEYELPLMLYDRIFNRDGQLMYPVSPDPERPWTDDVLGDAMIVNGRVQPFHPVAPRRYRLRIVNASNARFFRLGLSNGAPLLQIGADQGLLPAPVPLKNLLLAPGERADVLVDFAAMRGERVVLTNGALSMMRFRVGATPAEDPSRIPETLPPITGMPERSAARERTLTLNEYKDPAGNSMVMLLNRTPWHMPVTETAKLGSTEIWSLVNLTEEIHPIHLHHVRFVILDRRGFDPDAYLLENATLRYTTEALPPNANEQGWKDVAQCPPSMVTRIQISFAGFAGRYLWHCHVQEHEANDMMRPFDIIP